MDYEGGYGIPLNGRPQLRVAVWPQGQSPVCTGLSLRPMSCTPALSVTQSAAAAAVCGLWRYVSDGFNLLTLKIYLFIVIHHKVQMQDLFGEEV